MRLGLALLCVPDHDATWPVCTLTAKQQNFHVQTGHGTQCRWVQAYGWVVLGGDDSSSAAAWTEYWLKLFTSLLQSGMLHQQQSRAAPDKTSRAKKLGNSSHASLSSQPLNKPSLLQSRVPTGHRIFQNLL